MVVESVEVVWDNPTVDLLWATPGWLGGVVVVLLVLALVLRAWLNRTGRFHQVGSVVGAAKVVVLLALVVASAPYALAWVGQAWSNGHTKRATRFEEAFAQQLGNDYGEVAWEKKASPVGRPSPVDVGTVGTVEYSNTAAAECVVYLRVSRFGETSAAVRMVYTLRTCNPAT